MTTQQWTVPRTVFNDGEFELAVSDVAVFVQDRRQHKVVTMPPAVWVALVKAWQEAER